MENAQCVAYFGCQLFCRLPRIGNSLQWYGLKNQETEPFFEQSLVMEINSWLNLTVHLEWQGECEIYQKFNLSDKHRDRDTDTSASVKPGVGLVVRVAGLGPQGPELQPRWLLN